MRDQLISLEAARLAKQRGFDPYTFYYYDRYGERHEGGGVANWNNGYGDACACSTQSALQRWLREQHNLQVYVYSNTIDGNKKYKDYVAYINGIAINDARDEQFETYEEAMEAALEEALKNLN